MRKPHVHSPARHGGMKTDDATGMIGTCLGGTGINLSVLHGSSISKGLSNYNTKVVLEIA